MSNGSEVTQKRNGALGTHTNFSSKRVAGAFILMGSLSLLGSVLAVVCSQGFVFAWEAVKKAGDDPPKEVAFQLEFQLALQVYMNAILTGVVLSLLLATGFLGLRLLQVRPLNFRKSLFYFGRAFMVGGACFGLGCLAFRLQTVGTQNLSIAVVIHSLLWGGLGIVVADNWRERQTRTGWRVPHSVRAGLLWGACFPTLVVLFFPDIYVERLFSTDALIAIWAGVGCAALLVGCFWNNLETASIDDLTLGDAPKYE